MPIRKLSLFILEYPFGLALINPQRLLYGIVIFDNDTIAEECCDTVIEDIDFIDSRTVEYINKLEGLEEFMAKVTTGTYEFQMNEYRRIRDEINNAFFKLYCEMEERK